jgi:predicted MFS family arabinose efflux permease
MLYLAFGAAALALIVLAGRGKPILKRREWRIMAGVISLAAFAAASYFAVSNKWPAAITLIVVGLWLSFSARTTGAPQPARKPATGRMSLGEARSILGVEEGASSAEIQAAYSRLMRMAHPDKGGTSGLAAQLNAARDRLLKD